MCENKKNEKTSQPKAGAEGATEKMERDGGVVGAERRRARKLHNPEPTPPTLFFPCLIFQCSWLSLKFKWRETKKKKNRLKKETSDLGRVAGVVVVCEERWVGGAAEKKTCHLCISAL